MNAVLLVLLVLGQSNEQVQKIKLLQASELQRHEQSIKQWRRELAVSRKDESKSDQLRRYISIAASKIKAIKGGGIPATDLELDSLTTGSIGRLVAGGPSGHLWSLKVVEVLPDSLVIALTDKERVGGSSIPNGTSIPMEYLGRMVQYSMSSGSWEAADKGRLVLKGWSTVGLKAGDSFRRELLNCLVEVQPQQNGIWVLEKVDVEELKRLVSQRN